MIVARNIEDIRDAVAASCVTIGNFDGVHVGHKRLIEATCAKARAMGLTSAVVTFDPHPLRVLVGPHTPPFITAPEQKLELISELGPQLTLVVEFTRDLSALTPEEFVRRFLVEGLRMQEMVIGYDYHLGRKRTGDHAVLRALGERLGYGLERLDPVLVDDAVVSSTRIRDLILEGQVFEVKPLMERFHRIRGEVVRGHARGRSIGFPTANLRVFDELLPKPGVYAVWAEFDGRLRQGVANLGKNPTFGDQELSVEAHVLDYSGDLYGRTIGLHFVHRIRSERKFSGVEELKARIAQDVDLGRRILAEPASQARLLRPVIRRQDGPGDPGSTAL